MKSRWLTRSLLVSALVFLSACLPNFGVKDGAVSWVHLTSPTGQGYSFAAAATTATVTAASTNTDDNIRDVFWSNNGPWSSKLESCNTWDDVVDASTPEKVSQLSDVDISQPGVALRVAPTVDSKGYRAITVQQNVWGGGLWLFWVDTWDTTPNPDPNHSPFTGVALFDLSATVGKITGTDTTMAPPPWHICARVDGSTFSFMVWTGTNPQPSWGDPTQVHTVTLPAGWDYWGTAGSYLGHLHPGQQFTFSDLSAGAL